MKRTATVILAMATALLWGCNGSEYEPTDPEQYDMQKLLNERYETAVIGLWHNDTTLNDDTRYGISLELRSDKRYGQVTKTRQRQAGSGATGTADDTWQTVTADSTGGEWALRTRRNDDGTIGNYLVLTEEREGSVIQRWCCFTGADGNMLGVELLPFKEFIRVR